MNTPENNSQNSSLRVKDHLVSGENFDLIVDDELLMLQTYPQPDASQFGKYYDSDEYISHSDNKSGLLGFLYDVVKKRAIQKKLNLAESFSQNPKVLDVGCGTGEFLVAAKERNWKVQGVEVNDKARNISKAKDLFVKSDLSEVNEKFDAITLWHVLEHLPNLGKLSDGFAELLNPNGVLIIAVPNYRSFDAKYYKEFWAAYDVPRHLWHFSRDSIPQIFGDNFTLEKIRPMIFDSFYVSLLSEKYKTGNSFSMKAFFVGLWSNISAWRTKEYSSLIYCLKKAN